NHISSVATPDDYTVVFHTSKVFAPFLTSMGETPILPAHYFQHSASFVASGNYNHDPYNRTPFGTGPYKVTQWVSADYITLLPNKYYWGRKPYFQKIVVKIAPNVNTLLVQLRTGEVQLARVSQQHVDVARSIPGTALVTRPSQAWYHIDLKQYGFLRDQQVRVALDYATRSGRSWTKCCTAMVRCPPATSPRRCGPTRPPPSRTPSTSRRPPPCWPPTAS
ncbi:MAG: ABC transporter substrate-binding protein, partial [Chloroflexi bacterium]|nr:ABC transporter substrate-binding protein [Chloroflexota bacterium]